MSKFIKFTTVTISLIFSSLLFANEAKRYDDSAQWKSVVKINFKIGKRDEALKIINEHFAPASTKAKTPQPELVLEMHTGDYDLLVVWHMEGGINDMTWDVSPDNIAWRKALNDMVGGKDKAQEILNKYRSYIESVENDIALVNP